MRKKTGYLDNLDYWKEELANSQCITYPKTAAVKLVLSMRAKSDNDDRIAVMLSER